RRLLEPLRDVDLVRYDQIASQLAIPACAHILNRIVEDVFGLHPVQGILRSQQSGPRHPQGLSASRLPGRGALESAEAQSAEVLSLPPVCRRPANVVDGVVLMRVEARG